MNTEQLTFIHRFSRTVQVTMTVKDQPPAPGSMVNVNCEWIGRPRKKHVAAYRQWILVTNQFLCDRWQKSSLYALGTKPNETEIWAFEPGKPPRLLEKANTGIP